MTEFIQNIKLSSKNKKLTPKTYIKKKLYEPIDKNILKKSKKNKIKMEDFEIPLYSDYQDVVKVNYNVSQLKIICRHYKQKVSGNKSQLVFLVYNYLKYSYFSTKIQRIFRGHLVRYSKKLRGPGIVRKRCVNETDFFTLTELENIQDNQFYSFKDKDGFIYGFDICSLYNMIVNEKQEQNPYNRNKLPVKKIFKDIKAIIKLSKIYNYKINIEIDNDISQFSQEKQIEMKAINLFQKIDEGGFITDAKWILNLNRNRLRRFLTELIDVWQYRAQITNETKYKIDPLHGNPFFSYNINVLLHKCYDVLIKQILEIIEIFITRGVDQHSRSLGIFYVLGTLTTVSPTAANSLPWLYESFLQI